MNVDPMASQGYGWTTYRYGYDNPVNYTDPTGMLEDFVRTEEGNVQYDSRVTDQGTAEKYYGKNAKYRAPGDDFIDSKSGDHFLLGEFGSYTRNGVGGGVAYDYADVPYTPSSANEGPLSGVGLGQFGNMGQSGQSVDWTDRGIKHHMYDADKAVMTVGGTTVVGIIGGSWLMTGGAIWLGKTILTNTIEELMGVPTPAGYGRKQVVKSASSELAETVVKRTGGRLGNAATRAQIDDVALNLEKRGYTITGGGGRRAEEYLKPLNGGRKGGSYVDITATHPKYGTLRINTVDKYKNGLPTFRELNNASRIRQQIGPDEHLLLIPKP